MSPHPYFAESGKTQHLAKLARGVCSAVSRPGAGMSVSQQWFPAIDGVPLYGAEGGLDGFETKREAKAAAKKFQDECKEKIAQANGEMP